ncbi:hypothetical protein OF83DRAFT_485141 [Amylostereum chailletii]|nr:hypothetical protein OF83DRAFT_485141 [Amylostereum chailletii]
MLLAAPELNQEVPIRPYLDLRLICSEPVRRRLTGGRAGSSRRGWENSVYVDERGRWATVELSSRTRPAAASRFSLPKPPPSEMSRYGLHSWPISHSRVFPSLYPTSPDSIRRFCAYSSSASGPWTNPNPNAPAHSLWGRLSGASYGRASAPLDAFEEHTDCGYALGGKNATEPFARFLWTPFVF